MTTRIAVILFAGLAFVLPACEPAPNILETNILSAPGARRFPERAFEVSPEVVARPPSASSAPSPDQPAANPERNAYYGDLHVHTTYSFDAFTFGTTATPRDAYRYAQGEAIQHPAGFDVKLRQPLDFYAVTDHALFLGLAREAADTSTAFSKFAAAKPLHGLNDDGNKGILSIPRLMNTFGTFIPEILAGILDGEIDREIPAHVAKSAWVDIVDAAEEFYDPGSFTTFAAYEYTTSSDDRGNLHRNVIFRNNDRLPAEPFSRFHSQNPEGLWDWMDGLRAQGIESLAIPHNSNGSNGQMFKLVDWAGNPMDDAYVERRIRNEPLVEITQIKGTSETHPSLSGTDEWANFEITPYRVATMVYSEPAGSYARDALRRGLAFEEQNILNPYKFGFVGASDTHTGAISDNEADFHSKLGLLDQNGELRGSVSLPWYLSIPMRLIAPAQVGEVDGRSYTKAPTTTFGASGLAAVWAEENTRESIYDAFRRKETFATSGPRIRVRFFSGFDLDASLFDDGEAIGKLYESSVPMGGELTARRDTAPSFIAWVVGDAASAPLQRLQIIKGWAADGTTHERVYDVACSDGAVPDASTHRCPENGSQVDITDCSYTPTVGTTELKALWRDPEFDPGERAFYYVRALENPTCRWSTWDAVRAGVEPRPDTATTLQERAWSSPIWIEPTEG
ncbi:MAG: DUF3604 domain-containing protein [Myxococcota bacterium]|nr:DUF3604 domain-containing protein [Myxococcota bacterium]